MGASAKYFQVPKKKCDLNKTKLKGNKNWAYITCTYMYDEMDCIFLNNNIFNDCCRGQINNYPSCLSLFLHSLQVYMGIVVGIALYTLSC